MSGCEFIKGWRVRFLAFLLIITFIRECRRAGFPYIPLDGRFWGRSLNAGGVKDTASPCPMRPPGLCWLGQAGAGPWAPAERGRGLSGTPGAAEQGRLPPAAWKGGHVHLLLCLLNDLYLSSVLKIKFKICTQRWRLTCFLYEFWWITIDFWMWFLKSYF